MAIYSGYLVLLSTFTLKFVAIGSFNTSGLYLGPLSESFADSNQGTLALYCSPVVLVVTGNVFAACIRTVLPIWIAITDLQSGWQFALI